ncbi:hypothetical protein RO3G_14044 [Rhizopus delemar RA 99-880]|uniref:Uncharacterized protein n=1 Tax=Rhizopus delemar (strain RA 99-880 / ATCC MYA-4621 / FGSC 9543 / NRRL 43880) TaxID=246409 RepID=I1CLK3_RHIO9|nr:hypothetical protein RO3G_14044 [Rhizopus delemar RA 99-880]|eukprot:EIE89333.1 hypothetical protein RO3G_14044 [Rhizopus delemar RA 99-880]
MSKHDGKKLQKLIDLRSMKAKKDTSQVDDGPKACAQRRVPEFYYSDWLRLGFESTPLKRARLEDQYMVEEQRRLECQRRIEKQRRLEDLMYPSFITRYEDSINKLHELNHSR